MDLVSPLLTAGTLSQRSFAVSLNAVNLRRRDFLGLLGAGAFTAACPASAFAATVAKRSIPGRSVIPAALTPLDEKLALHLADFRRHIATLAAVPGVTAIMVNGAAGHDNTLTRDERRRLIAEAVAAVGPRVAIMAALRETKDDSTLAPFARDAEAEGAHALVIMPPTNKADETWERARIRFDHALAASTLPVAFYQTGYDTETLTRLAALPPVFAIKEGSGSPAVFERNMRSVRALGRDVAIWTTHSSWLLSDLALGADGLLSGMGSVAAELQVALAEAVWRSDLAAARKINDRLFPLTQVFYRPGSDAHSRMKYALKKLGRFQHDLVRPPRKSIDDAERAAIDRALSQSGLI
jgi:4-hydroxy-tetrahydrodipicolinate synthase